MEYIQKTIIKKFNDPIKFDILLLGLYFILAPFEIMLRFGPGTILKYIAGLFVIIGVFRFLTTNQRKGITDPIIFSIILLIIISYISLLWTIDMDTSININTTNFFLQLLFIFAYIRIYSYKDQFIIKWSILLGGIAVFIYLLINGFYTTYSNRSALGETDPNEFAALLVLPFFIAFGQLINKRKLIFIVILLIILFLILITGSRGALIAIVVGLIYYTYKNIKFKTFIYLFLLVIIFYLIILPFIPEAVTDRLWGQGAYTNDFGVKDTRVDIWSAIYYNVFPNLSVIGNGSGSGSILLSKYFLQLTGTHNTYFSLIIDYGILGLPIFLYFLVKMFKRINLEKDYGKICSFIAILIIIFFLDAYYKKYLWNVLIYCVISVGSCETISIKKKILIIPDNSKKDE